MGGLLAAKKTVIIFERPKITWNKAKSDVAFMAPSKSNLALRPVGSASGSTLLIILPPKVRLSRVHP